MANRNFCEFEGALDKGLVVLFAAVQQTGATTIAFQQWNAGSRTYSAAPSGGFRGIKSVTRTGTGAWSIVLQDSYQRVLGLNVISSIAGGSAAAPSVGINATGTNVNSATAPTLNIQFLSSGSTAADPANGELVIVEIQLQNSTAL